MKKFLQFLFLYFLCSLSLNSLGQLNNNCSNAIQVCNNQLAEKLDDGPGTQECPTGGCGCMIAGEKNTRWFKIVVQTAGTLEFTIRPYNGTADYDFSVWNRGVGGSCPTGAALGTPDRCNFAAPKSPTGIRGTTNGNSNGASGNLFSNNMAVTAGQVIYILVDNYDGTQEGFYLDFFGGAPGSGTGTTATFSCSGINVCTTCNDADCKSYYFASPDDYSFDETAANGACHSNFGYANTKTATVCGTFTVPVPHNTVEFPLNRGYEVTTTNGANSTTCLNSAVITYSVWNDCSSAPLMPNPGTGIYTGLNNVSTYKVCKTITVTGADCWLSRVCLPYWTMVQNDVICSATPLTVNAAPIAGTNVGASSDLDAGCTGYQDVYYSFTAPVSGRVQINVAPDASSDVKVSLIGPMAGLDEGINDCNLTCSQLGESNVAGGCNDNVGRNGVERLFAFVIPGQTYYVWVSGTIARPNSNFTIQVTETITNNADPKPGPDLVGTPDAIPANDDCSNAIDLNPMCSLRAGTNLGATAICTDPDPEYVDALTLENDVWYKWTAPLNNGNSQVTLQITSIVCTDGAGNNTGNGNGAIQFGVFRGSCASLTPVTNGNTTVTFTPIAGQTYYFVIDGNAGAQCNFNINIKRPTITSQSCTAGGGNFCAGSTIGASFNYSYTGSNPGFRWAYCKSTVWGTPCTIDLNVPSTYSIYNPALGLPSPGCTPSTYTFVGYLLADNGATTIAPGYPTPQPVSAVCLRETTPCTFNIYPDIRNTVTVTRTNCNQTVIANASCSPAPPITITGNTNQTYGAGSSGAFTPVTVTWSAPYAATAPATCSSYVINGNYACPGATGADFCANAPQLTLGVPMNSNNNVTAVASDRLNYCVIGAGSGVWFTFVAPNSGNVNINLTNVGSGGSNLNAALFLFDSRVAQYIDGTPDLVFQSDVCASCTDLASTFNKNDQLLNCNFPDVNNGNVSMAMSQLNPGETYYIMVDGKNVATYNTGNFTITVSDAGGGPIRPGNDACLGAIDITSTCGTSAGNNVGATSNCGNDLLFPGASTENSVWYTYTAVASGPTIIQYKYAIGTHCAAIGAQPGIQFSLYTSNDNTCNGTFTNIPTGTVSAGTTNGSVTVTLTTGQKYYILIDGYGGNECKYEFQIYNHTACCAADLGSTEGVDRILCFGDQVTYGVTANPINFGLNAQDNPVIGWQFSTAQPSIINPFNPANNGKPFIVGNIDIVTPGTVITDVYRDQQGNFPNLSSLATTPTLNNQTTDFPIPVLTNIPAGLTFNPLTDTITLCVNLYMRRFADLDLFLVAPDGSVYNLMNDMCTLSTGGSINVCFSNFGTVGNISGATCPATAGDEIAGYYLPSASWAGIDGETINNGVGGTWKLRVTDDLTGVNTETFFLGANLEIKKPYTKTGPPVVGPHNGDLNIINNNPFQFGPQTFWLTPVTFVDFDAATNTFTRDSCYHYGTPVKVTLLERVTTPTFTSNCLAPNDGSNGISLSITSPTGGMPGIAYPATNNTLFFTNNTAINPIPTSATAWTNSDINVTGFNTAATLSAATNITVCVNFSPAHTFASDIDLQLIAPNGGVLSLTQERGADGNLTGSYCFVSTGVMLPNLGDVNIPNGSYLWDGNYANIANTLLNGLWRLQIRDDAAGDVGGLLNWSLTLNGLLPTVVNNFAYTVVGTGAAAPSPVFTSPPVQESETSNPFTVLDGQGWNVEFTDINGCKSSIGGTYNKPNPGTIVIDPTVCDGQIVNFTTANQIQLLAQYKVTIDFDAFPQDISWYIFDGNNRVVASSSTFGATDGANITSTLANLNPNDGPFRFQLFDAGYNGLGNGGGTANNGGSTTNNFIKVEEIHADGSSLVLFNQSYTYCTPTPCASPAGSVFNNIDLNLGTPLGTFASGITITLENDATCTGSTVAGGVATNPDGTGTVNTNNSGITPAATYSIQYTITDQYGCSKTVCGPVEVFPPVTITPTINCSVNPPVVSVNASCPGCNATYVAEYSYNGGTTWTTLTSANFQDIYTLAHVKNVLTGVTSCEVSSVKLADCPTVLPIELIYITANAIDNQYIKVSWATASELNTKIFEVLRSTDAVNFTKIGEVNAAGNSSTVKSYFYNDYEVTAGIVYYYQIREVDMDNSTHLTNIVHAKLENEKFEIISIYPNPTIANTIITMYSKEETEVTLAVYNDLGELMKDDAKILKAGLNEWNVSTEKWAKGVYYFIINNGEKPVTRQVIKLQ